jgi:hypothetical protein
MSLSSTFDHELGREIAISGCPSLQKSAGLEERKGDLGNATFDEYFGCSCGEKMILAINVEIWGILVRYIYIYYYMTGQHWLSMAPK